MIRNAQYKKEGKGSDNVEGSRYTPPALEQDGTISAAARRSSGQWLSAMVEITAAHAVAAVGSVAFASTLVHPLDTVETIVQVLLNSWASCKFWIKFARHQEILMNMCVSEALLAGLAAGTMEALVCNPFELLKLFTNPTAWDCNLRLLSVILGKQPDLAAFKEYPWTMTGSGRPPLAYEVRELSNITSLEGLGALLRSLGQELLDSVFGGFFFSTGQFVHIAMLNWKAMEDQPRSVVDIGPVFPLGLGASIAAGFSGAFAAAASHCFDTAKIRSHAVVVPKAYHRLIENSCFVDFFPGWLEVEWHSLCL